MGGGVGVGVGPSPAPARRLSGQGPRCSVRCWRGAWAASGVARDRWPAWPASITGYLCSLCPFMDGNQVLIEISCQKERLSQTQLESRGRRVNGETQSLVWPQQGARSFTHCPWRQPVGGARACASHLPLAAQVRPLHPRLLCEMSCPGPQETGGTCRWQWGRPRGLPKLPSQAPTVGEARHLNLAQRPRGSMSRELVLRPARTCA